MKTILYIFISLTIGIAIGFFCGKFYFEVEIFEKQYQPEVEISVKKMEKNREFYELINYDGDNWLDVWDEYMIQHSCDDYYPV